MKTKITGFLRFSELNSTNVVNALMFFHDLSHQSPTFYGNIKRLLDVPIKHTQVNSKM